MLTKVGITIISCLFAFDLSFAESLVIDCREAESHAVQTPADQHSDSNHLQMPFIANEGQGNDRVAFYTPIFGGTFFVTHHGEIIYSLAKGGQEKNGLMVQETFVGGRVGETQGEEPSATQVNYFKGKEFSKWRNGISTYNVVTLGEVYPGIEVKLKARRNNVEKLFFVKPGFHPEDIRVKVSESMTMKVDKNGDMRIETRLGPVVFTKPVAFQYLPNPLRKEGYIKKTVKVEYKVNGNEYGFKTGDYNKSSTLIIDPMLASTFLGGSYKDGMWRGVSMVLGADGCVYTTGQTVSLNFPTISGALDETYNGGGGDVFISKFSKDLKTLISSTYLGGTGKEEYPALALDSSGYVFVMGQTSSTDFPVTPGAYDQIHNGGGYDVFVSKLDSNLSTLMASTYLGGGGAEAGSSNDMTVDDNGNVYVLSRTESLDFPTTANAFDNSYNGAGDLFIARLDNSLSTLTASTFIGGCAEDAFAAIAIDNNGDLFASGSTSSPDFPVTPGAYDTSFSGAYYDIFISKLAPDLSTLLASTYLGGDTEGGTGKCMALDSSGNVYVSGHVSEGFPTTPGAYDTTHNGIQEGFISKLNNNLTTLQASTFLSGDSSSFAHGSTLACDGNGYIYISGYTPSPDFPVTPSAYDETYNGGDDDAYIAKLDMDLSMLCAATFLGGENDEGGESIAVDPEGDIWLAGITKSTDFPVSPGAYDETYNGGAFDLFVVHLDSDLSVDPPLRADVNEISACTGGNVYFTLNAGPAHAARQYLVLGTTSGTQPGYPLPGGQAVLPLNWDLLTDAVTLLLNTTLFNDFFSTLDSSGRSTAQVDTVPLSPVFVGVIMHYAYCSNDPFNFVSNPVEVRIVP